MESELASAVMSVAHDPWTIGSTIAAAISAFFAMIAAGISLWQAMAFRLETRNDKILAKQIATFGHSAAESPDFFRSRKLLVESFGAWNKGDSLDGAVVNELLMKDESLRDSFNYVLNHFGRMASAYHYEIIDRNIAREMFRYSLLGFWRKFQNYIGPQFAENAALRETYKHTTALIKKWEAEGET